MRKVNLKKEAAKIVANTEIEGEITEAVLKEYCPKAWSQDFKKAKTPAQRADFLYSADEYRLTMQKEVDIFRL